MAIDTEDQTAAAKKVKFLCSFGGKILPRPSDGALRYVGGQTRIISLPKTVSFPEMIQKMRDVYGGPVNLKYQLPEEDLDALVSVSCGEDVENMMEEYQKLARVTVDASPKLRVFLFAEGNGGAVTAFSGDSMGQSYIEAVNGIGQLRRKVCKSRSALTHTSDGILLANVGDESRTENCGGMDGVSSMASAVQCPSVQDGSNLISSVAAVSRSESVRAETRFSQSQIMASVQMDALISADVRPEPTVPGLITPETPTSASIAGYVLPTYKDQQQDVFNHVSSVPNCGHVQCLSSQHLVFGGAPVQFVTLDQHSHMPGTSISTVPLSPVPFLDTVKPSTSMLESCLDGTFLGPVRPSTSRLDSCLDGSEYGKLGKVPSESSHKAFQSLAQLPPIPPLLVQASHIDGYGGMYAWPQVTPPSHQAQQVSAAKLEECLTYQNAPSHVLSGTVIHDNIGTVSQTSSVVHIKQNRNIPSSNDPYKYICAALTNVSVKRDNVTNVASTPGACGHHQIPMVQHEIGSIAHHKTENSHQYRLPLPSGSGGLPSDLLSLYESYPNHHTQATCEGSLRQKLHQHPPSVPGQHHSFRHISSTNPLCNGNTTARYGMLETFDPPSVYVRNDSIRPVDGLVEKLNLNRDKQMKIVEKSNGSSPEDLSENVALSSGNPNVQVEEGSLFPNNVSATRNISESHHSVPLSSVLEVPCLPNVHDLNSNKLPILLEDITELSDHPGIEAEPPIPHALLLGVSSATNQLCDNEQRENPLVHSGNCSKALSALSFSNLLSPPSNFSELNVGIQGTQQPTHSDSLFSGTDPLGILQNGHTILPNPLSVACKEPLFLEDSCIDKHLANGESLLSISSEGGVHHEPLDALKKKDLFSGLVPPVMDWTEKQIKKDMQDVVDDIGVSSLGPIVPHDPAGGHETGESSLVRKCDTCPHAEIVDPKGTLSIGDKKIEPEKIVYHGFLVTDDIGRLQIIKNSDLEELSELGSGMYGTVYHGKWKGSDVAIKWINNRCFAGKTSDAERLRADFWNEVRNLADLHHPNVVAFYGVVLDGPGESVATVTEYMVDGSLRRALQRNDKILDKRKRLLIAMDVAFGMEYLHGKNIVHFGLKSDNLLVNLSDHQRPICKVGDLGLSKVKRQTIISGSVRGTLPWMAPVLNGCSNLVSEKVDVFSFGIIMWELLSGEEPYANLHCGAIIGGVVNNTLRPPIPNSCDPGWKSLMEKCWSVEPSERPTFTEIVATLRSIATSLPKKEEA